MNDNDKKRMMDAQYISDENAKRIIEQGEQKQNQDLINNLNAVNNNVVRNQPNTDLFRNPEYTKKALPSLESGKKPNKSTSVNPEGNTFAKSMASSENAARDAIRRGNSKEVNSGLNNLNKNKRMKDDLNANSFHHPSGLDTRAAENQINSQANSAIESRAKNKGGLLGSGLGAGLFGGDKNQKVRDSISSGGVTFKVTGLKKKIMLYGGLAATFLLFLLLSFSALMVYTVTDVANENGEGLTEDIENTMVENIDKVAMNSAVTNDMLAYTVLDKTNSISSIKLGGPNTLALTTSSKTTSTVSTTNDFDFDINSLSELYPAYKDYQSSKYAYAFYYKLYSLNNAYKELCGKQVLDLPLLMITLKLESDNMQEVFVSNLGYISEDQLTKENLDEMFSEYYNYYYNWAGYNITSYSSVHDMEILAQHMVDVKGIRACTYDEEKYDEFLKEFLEKKYFINTGKGSGSYGTSSSNYFQKYDLTEFQLIEIANLCGQEQGHSNPAGAAAEASLMANKFEMSGGEYARKYTTNGEALYHYVRGTGKEPKDWWWAEAPTHMSERKSTPEVIEAVRDVLVNGNRTLPKYVDSHDCFDCNRKRKCPSGVRGDICEVILNGVTYTSLSQMQDKSHFIPHVTQVVNVYGSSKKTFYSFPSPAGDPFSYKNPKLREKFGECHYDYDTKQFVDCIDFTDVFVKWLVEIANDDSHGYSQLTRSSLIDFDCSSLVYYGLINSGFSTNELGSVPFTTHNERDILKKLGFTEIALNSSNLNSLQKGDILWTKGHTEVYIGESMTVGAHSASNGDISDGQYGDQNGKEISVVNMNTNNYWQYAYRYER